MIHWSDEQFSSGGAEVVVRRISVSSLRYAKAAMLLYVDDKREGRRTLAESGWPGAALRSVDDEIQQLQAIADGIPGEPSGVLRDLKSVTASQHAAVTSKDSSNDLHLKALSISGFRGIDSLTIPRLGRVTLLSGRNGIGKTTVLDAVRAYAARGRPEVLVELLKRNEELVRHADKNDAPVDLPDIAALFHARTHDGCISIGPNCEEDALRLELSGPKEWPDECATQFARIGLEQAIRVQVGNRTTFLPWAPPSEADVRRVRRAYRGYVDDDLPEEIACNPFGPGPTPNEKLAEFWDDASLGPEEELAMEALRLVLGRKLQRVAVVGQAFRGSGRRFVVRLAGGMRAPLASFGDGAVRLFGIALTLVRSRGGFLVIDEAENGIHHSIQQEFWRLVFEAAVDHDVQVLATTHSKDCIDGFGRAAKEFTSSEGVLLRLERHNGKLRAVQYVEDEIVTAAEQGIETR